MTDTITVKKAKVAGVARSQSPLRPEKDCLRDGRYPTGHC